MLILSLFILQALSSLDCYDPELDGDMKVGLNGKSSRLSRKLLSFNFISTEKDSKIKANQDPEVTQALQDAQLARQKPSVQQFINDLNKKAKHVLENMGTQILTDLNINKNITSILQIVTDDFAMMMQNYYDFKTSDRTNLIVDQNFMYVDLVETSGRLLYSEGRAMLEEIISNHNLTSRNKTVDLLNEKIFTLSVEGKKEGMKYVCETYSVCKEYLTFTDYATNLMGEIIKLSDDKLRKFVAILISILKNHEEFFASVTEKEDRELIMNQLHPLSTDWVAIRDYVVAVREVMVQKFKGDFNDEEEIIVKTRAMRILLEIISKALSTEEDLLTIDLENSLSTIKHWGDDEDKEINSSWEAFVKKVIKILDYNLSRVARKEMSVLIKAMVRGAADNDNMVIDLLLMGSRYVQSEQLPLDMGIIV